jgi:hypothetical protein
MKKEFVSLMKELRSVCHPLLIAGELDKLENEMNRIIVAAGWEKQEYDETYPKYLLDFSKSDDPNDWIIEYSPENAKIITK